MLLAHNHHHPTDPSVGPARSGAVLIAVLLDLGRLEAIKSSRHHKLNGRQA